MISFDDVFKVGYLGKLHGLQGEINFHLENNYFVNIDCPYLILDLDGILTPFFISGYRLKNTETALIQFEDINTSLYLNQLLEKEAFLPIKYLSDEVFESENISDADIWYTLLNFSVYDKSGKLIGEIKNIDTQTINTLLLLEDAQGLQKIIPAVDSWIIDISKEEKRIIFSLPEGLLD